ncbi:hypothetical protein K504DRAFT_464309 [Pleomassaria siparia CBS 279.74]|uniref:F-box domain-containing protein n=1 Tax=Pleomassaria siparia CBS 279.74 TaxID=1314801 RepID=A0A6G1KIK2_9PLEO|nr:hypothetical protein K504DRAFT_464309 [Pleomassaria siparia CBS 279.74]
MNSAPGIVHAFKRLGSSRARQQALAALVSELDPYDHRYLKAKLDSKDFRFDIVGSLPLELVATIFAYLDTSTPYRLQCVSKLWQNKLCSTHVLKSSLNEWDGKTNAARDEYAVCLREAKAIHRFRMGIPVKHVETSWPSASCAAGVFTITDVLVHHHFVWVSPDWRALNVCDLRSVEHPFTLCGEAREIISGVSLSEELVAFVTVKGICYVRSLDDNKRKQFRLPLALTRHLICRGRLVACGGFVNDVVTIYIWDFDTQSGKSFDISLEDQPFANRDHSSDQSKILALLPDPHTRTIAVFTTDQPDPFVRVPVCSGDDATSIYYTRFTFDGKPIRDGNIYLPDLVGLDLLGLRPVGSRGEFGLAIKTLQPGAIWPMDYSLQFDENLDEFTDAKCPVFASSAEPTTKRESAWETWRDVCIDSRFAWWNDTFFKLPDWVRMELGAERQEQVLLSHLGHRHAFEEDEMYKPQIIVDSQSLELHHHRHLYVNDKYAVVLGKVASHVIYFDDDKDGQS